MNPGRSRRAAGSVFSLQLRAVAEDERDEDEDDAGDHTGQVADDVDALHAEKGGSGGGDGDGRDGDADAADAELLSCSAPRSVKGVPSASSALR